MAERPIPFSAPMIRALLAGTKTQTRRVFKVPSGCSWYEALGGEREGFLQDDTGPAWWHVDEQRCPYGSVGDRLWVREAFRFPSTLDKLSPVGVGEKAMAAGYPKPWCPTQYEADGTRRTEHEWRHFMTPPYTTEAGRLRAGMHMPRWASRITLEVTDVRVERLQAISVGDAIAEGIPRGGPENPDGIEQREYRALWEQINGPGAWDANPWVWAITFRRLP